jgi:hypothetical protein
MFIWLEKRLSPNKSPRDKLMNSTIEYGFHLNDLKVKWKGDKLVAYKYLPLSTNPPRRRSQTRPRPWKMNTQIALAFFRQCVFSPMRYFTVGIPWKWARGPCFISFPVFKYRKCDISHLRYTLFVFPLKKITLKHFQIVPNILDLSWFSILSLQYWLMIMVYEQG